LEEIMKDAEFITIQYPSVRQFTADIGRIDHGKHYVRSLLEVDVTEALQKLRAMRAPGKKVSFLAWFVKVLADAVARHPPINGIRRGRGKVVVFKEVNISVIVEKKVDGKSVPLPLVLRDVAAKSLLDLNAEIQAAVDQSVEHAGNLVLGRGENEGLLNLALVLPQWLRLAFMRLFILGSPRRVQDMMGTVMISSLGTVGRLCGWILPTSMHPLSIGIGSLNKKPAIRQGAIEKRDILHLTVAFDHDVIDGMPALAFVDDLVARLETGAGLEP
jgi:pyruvate/2-oxoglutarate dehydrogenase complex dihydrolipoamide acyltransferase (E2) component